MSNVSKFIGNERGDAKCEEADGCPTEMAVLKRYWRETQSIKNEVFLTEELDNLTDVLDSASVPYEDGQSMKFSITGRVKWYLNHNTDPLREQVEKLTKERDEYKSGFEAAASKYRNLKSQMQEIINVC